MWGRLLRVYGIYIRHSSGKTFMIHIYNKLQLQWIFVPFENDYCCIKDFKISEIPKDLLLQLMGG